jgi:hypothetical protein
VPASRLVSRIWLISTWLYLVGYLVALGFSTGGTFMGAMSPLQEILAAPIFLSSGRWLGHLPGCCSGRQRDRSVEASGFVLGDHDRHPLSRIDASGVGASRLG